MLGPGLGLQAWGETLFNAVTALSLPLLLDADALNLLSKQQMKRDNWVLTPHPGEAARLLGCSVREVMQDRMAAANELRSVYGGVIVLKGAGTVISSDSARPPAICSDGNPGMATAGMGDLLSGVIGALLAQGYDPEIAAELGVCLHSAAADRAAESGHPG